MLGLKLIMLVKEAPGGKGKPSHDELVYWRKYASLCIKELNLYIEDKFMENLI